MEGDEDRIEESSARLVGRSNHNIVDGGSVGESRWVDGSEVDSESPPWSLLDENDSRLGYGSMRRRLVKKPKKVNSFDVEAMEIAGAHHHHSKLLFSAMIPPIALRFGVSWACERFLSVAIVGKSVQCCLVDPKFDMV
ncbi:hypothetical protein H0E87_015609 [Populus deltoides]|uniref:Uncharacterized protein n=1 Tax=Populus deltoides TaxID=3696 RepID=A0A8T2Y5M9_POPDE|nr:hypothetical protein H0E87_015609 [Populus deltoides]